MPNYSYITAYSADSSGSQTGIVNTNSLSLTMPYHVSGAAQAAFLCIKAVDAAGNQSADSSCTGFTVPAKPNVPLPVVVPNAPSGLTVSAISNQTLEVSWGNNNALTQVPTQLVRRSANGIDEETVTLASGVSAYRKMALPSRATKCFRARAVSGVLMSEFTDESCATTK